MTAIPWLVALPFAINVAANLVFAPPQFGLRKLPLASLDIVVVWGTIAAVLQLSITWMNRGEVPLPRGTPQRGPLPFRRRAY